MSVKTFLLNDTLLRLTTDKKMENLSVIWVGLYMPCRLCDDSLLKVDYLIIFIICDTDLVNKLTLQMYTLHKYK